MKSCPKCDEVAGQAEVAAMKEPSWDRGEVLSMERMRVNRLEIAIVSIVVCFIVNGCNDSEPQVRGQDTTYDVLNKLRLSAVNRNRKMYQECWAATTDPDRKYVEIEWAYQDAVRAFNAALDASYGAGASALFWSMSDVDGVSVYMTVIDANASGWPEQKDVVPDEAKTRVDIPRTDGDVVKLTLVRHESHWFIKLPYNKDTREALCTVYAGSKTAIDATARSIGKMPLRELKAKLYVELVKEGLRRGDTPDEPE